jgi:hypothetical protein
MTMPNEVDVVVAADRASDDRSYVDWPAIFAGIAIATAISIVLLTFGSAIGLNFTNFTASDGVPVIWIAIAAATWLLWVQISSFMAGGYVTGRMRKRHHDANEDESDMRDGAHGLLVWAGSLILGAFIAISGVGAAATAVGTVTGAAASLAGEAAGEAAADDAAPQAYFVDMLFRPAPAATPSAAASTADTGDLRGEATRILARSAATGELGEADRTYLAQRVAANSGLSPEQAAARVDEVAASVEAARQDAAEVAEQTRRMTVLGAFLTAAAFLVSAVGAYWAAQKGGNHRDRNMAFPDVFRRW